MKKKQSGFLQLILWISSVRLSTKFGNKLAINLMLSINFILWVILSTVSLTSLSIFAIFFFIETDLVLYFSLFSQIHCLSNSLGKSTIIKL